MKTYINLVKFLKDVKEEYLLLIPKIEFTLNGELISYKYGNVYVYEGELICVYADSVKNAFLGLYFVKCKSLGGKNQEIKYEELNSINKRDLIYIGNYFEKTAFVESYVNNNFGRSGLLNYLYTNYRENLQFVKFQLKNDSSTQRIHDIMINTSIDFEIESNNYEFSYKEAEFYLNKDIEVYFYAPFIKNDILKIELPFESIGVISESHVIMPLIKDAEVYINELIDDKLESYLITDWMTKQFENNYKNIQTLYKKDNCLDYVYFLSSMRN